MSTSHTGADIAAATAYIAGAPTADAAVAVVARFASFTSRTEVTRLRDALAADHERALPIEPDDRVPMLRNAMRRAAIRECDRQIGA